MGCYVEVEDEVEIGSWWMRADSISEEVEKEGQDGRRRREKVWSSYVMREARQTSASWPAVDGAARKAGTSGLIMASSLERASWGRAGGWQGKRSRGRVVERAWKQNGNGSGQDSHQPCSE